MIRVQDVLDGVWNAIGMQEENEALEWMREKLEERGSLVFPNTDDIRKWALDNTDLVEPEEG